jgi:MFS family permease
MTSGEMRAALAHRINDRVFYGWVMLAVAALGLFASGPGQSHIFSVFITPIGQDLGISYTSISSAYAVATLVAAFGLPYVGRLVDRFGPRTVILVVSALLGLAAIGFGAITNLVVLALGFGALRFLGQGSLMLVCANLVAQWFNRKRGLAMGLMAYGFSASMAVHPPFAQWLIDLVGWREAWVWLGLITWLLLLPPILLLIHNKPEDLRLQPDGGADEEAAQGRTPSPAQRADVGLTIGQALRTPAFWIIALSLGTLSMLVTGLFFHQVSIFANRGLTPQAASSIFPVSAVVMVATMPFIGRLLDRLPTQPVFACAMLTMTASMLFLTVVHELWTAVVYGVIFGVVNAAIHTHMPYLWPRFFGRRYLGSIQGTGQTIAVVGASLGPLPFGASFDYTGSYLLALFGLAVIPVVCAVAILFMQPPRLEDYRAEPATGAGAD